MSSSDLLDELKKLMEPEGQDDKRLAPQPDLSEVLYVDPAPGGESRNCKNCVLWGSSDSKCSLMSIETDTTEDSVCGYHVFGQPSKRHIQFDGISPVNPKFAGLVVVKGGASCQSCNWMSPGDDDEDGVCLAVTKRKKQAHVHPKGCCARWAPKQSIPDPKTT